MQVPSTKQLFPNLLAGLILGLVTLVYSISGTALMFSGKLAAWFPQGVAVTLLGAAIVSFIVPFRSTIPYVIAGPDPKAMVILALVTSSLGERLQDAHISSQIFPTIWAAIMVGTIAAGAFLFLVGRLHLGRLARFIPYPVMGGYLAGTGWLITSSSFKVMANQPLTLAHLPGLLQADQMGRWLPGLIFALTLPVILKRVQQFWALPAALLGAIGLFHLSFWLINQFLPIQNPSDWFFEPPPGGQLWQSINFTLLSHVDWLALIPQIGTLMAMVIVVLISTLLDTTGVEIAARQDINLDHELQANGLANVIAGLCGGLVGTSSINRTLLNKKAQANHPVAGATVGVFCTFVLFFGSDLLAYFPKAIFGGLLLYLGLNLLMEWVFAARKRLPLLDYSLVLLILFVIAIKGFLEGVGTGIVLACLMFIYNYGRSQVIKYSLSGQAFQSNVERPLNQKILLREQGESIYILCLQGYIFFGTANTLREHIRQRLIASELSPLKFLVLDFRLVSGLDSSAIFSFTRIKQLAETNTLKLVLTNLSPAMQQQLAHTVFQADEPDTCQLFPDLDRGLEWCENQILAAHTWRRARSLPILMQLETIFVQPEQASTFTDYLDHVTLATGQFLFHQGDPAGSIFFVESGQLTILLDLGGNSDKRLRTTGPGTIVGEMSFFRDCPRVASVIADEPTKLYILSKESFQGLQKNHPDVALAFQDYVIRLLSDRLSAADQEIWALLQ